MVIGIEKNIRRHLSVRVAIKCDVILLQPSFEPFLNDVSDDILLFYDDVDITEVEADLPLHGFNFINIEKSVIDFFCCESERELIIHCYCLLR